MKHFAWLFILALNGSQFQLFCHTQIRSKGEQSTECEMDCSQIIKEAIPRKTLNKFRLVMVICWTAVGTIVCGVFTGIESKESRVNFRCDVTGDIDKDFIRDECYHQYLQNHKLGIPLYAFILINVSLIPIVTLAYCYCVKSTVNILERSHQNAGV